MGNVLFMRKGETHAAPLTGVSLADIAEGSIVKINENGSPVEFYVAKHDYESGLNGTGRTLLVRKNLHSTQKWGSNNVYSTSAIDTWFNGTYKALLDAEVQNAIGTTKFYCNPGNGATNTNRVTTYSRAVFTVSTDEVGEAFSSMVKNAEGSALPVASTILIGYLNGTATRYWTRSPASGSSEAYEILASGSCTSAGVGNTFGARPCFTLPSTALFDEETLEFKGVA